MCPYTRWRLTFQSQTVYTDATTLAAGSRREPAAIGPPTVFPPANAIWQLRQRQGRCQVARAEHSLVLNESISSWRSIVVMWRSFCKRYGRSRPLTPLSASQLLSNSRTLCKTEISAVSYNKQRSARQTLSILVDCESLCTQQWHTYVIPTETLHNATRVTRHRHELMPGFQRSVFPFVPSFTVSRYRNWILPRTLGSAVA